MTRKTIKDKKIADFIQSKSYLSKKYDLVKNYVKKAMGSFQKEEQISSAFSVYNQALQETSDFIKEAERRIDIYSTMKPTLTAYPRMEIKEESSELDLIINNLKKNNNVDSYSKKAIINKNDLGTNLKGDS